MERLEAAALLRISKRLRRTPTNAIRRILRTAMTELMKMSASLSHVVSPIFSIHSKRRWTKTQGCPLPFPTLSERLLQTTSKTKSETMQTFFFFFFIEDKGRQVHLSLLGDPSFEWKTPTCVHVQRVCVWRVLLVFFFTKRKRRR